MPNLIPPIPNDLIGENHRWREWFYNLGYYIQTAQVGKNPWTVIQGGTGATTLTGYIKGSGQNPLTGVSSIPTTDLSGTLLAVTMPALTGDVTNTVGTLATTVGSVGGSSAANIHSAELAANAATNLNTVSTIVKRDTSGNFSAGTASLSGLGLSGIGTYTAVGTQEVISQDASVFYEGQQSTLTSGSVYTTLGNQLAMKLWTHNFSVNTSGNIGTANATDYCAMMAYREDDKLMGWCSSAAVTAGNTPTLANTWYIDNITGVFNGGVQSSDNSIINGEHLIAQVATGGTLTAGGSTTATTYTTDMHHAWCTGANVTWASIGVNQEGFGTAVQFTGAASVTGIGHGTRIEGRNSMRHSTKEVTLSVWMSNSLLTSVTWTVYYINAWDAFGTNGSGAKTQIATGTISLAAADTILRQYTVSFNAGTSAPNGMTIEFTVGAQTSGTWVITGEDLVNGIGRRPYPKLTYDKVLSQCMRYFQHAPREMMGYVTTAGTTGVIGVHASLPVIMRTDVPPVLNSTSPYVEAPWFNTAITVTGASITASHPFTATGAVSFLMTATNFSPALPAGSTAMLYGTYINLDARL